MKHEERAPQTWRLALAALCLAIFALASPAAAAGEKTTTPAAAKKAPAPATSSKTAPAASNKTPAAPATPTKSPSAPAAPNGGGKFVSVKKDGVNVRSGPNASKEVLWELFKDFPVQILSEQGQWAQIQDFEGDKGWVSKPLLSDQKTVIVKAKTANLRVGPGTNYEVAATVKYGVVFKPVQKDKDWVKVSHEDGTTGWLNKDLIWPSE